MPLKTQPTVAPFRLLERILLQCNRYLLDTAGLFCYNESTPKQKGTPPLMKKLISGLLSAILLCGALTACRPTDPPTESPNTTETPPPAVTTAPPDKEPVFVTQRDLTGGMRLQILRWVLSLHHPGGPKVITAVLVRGHGSRDHRRRVREMLGCGYKGGQQATSQRVQEPLEAGKGPETDSLLDSSRNAAPPTPCF